jgi:hypothetical protein
MLNDLLFIAFFFITRIILPIAVTYVIGVLIERALNRSAQARPTRTVELTEPRTA